MIEIQGHVDSKAPKHLREKLNVSFTTDVTNRISMKQGKRLVQYAETKFYEQNPSMKNLANKKFFFNKIIVKVLSSKDDQ